MIKDLRHQKDMQLGMYIDYIGPILGNNWSMQSQELKQESCRNWCAWKFLKVGIPPPGYLKP